MFVCCVRYPTNIHTTKNWIYNKLRISSHAARCSLLSLIHELTKQIFSSVSCYPLKYQNVPFDNSVNFLAECAGLWKKTLSVGVCFFAFNVYVCVRVQ